MSTLSSQSFSQESGSYPSNFKEQFLPIWKRAKAYTLETAAAMPDSLYDYRPAETVMTFREQLIHVANNLFSLNARFVQAAPIPQTQEASSLTSKESVIAYLESAFDFVGESLNMDESALNAPAPGFWSPDSADKKTLLLLMRDHMTHHRAQLILYLRLNGIEPPRYRGW